MAVVENLTAGLEVLVVCLEAEAVVLVEPLAALAAQEDWEDAEKSGCIFTDEWNNKKESSRR